MSGPSSDPVVQALQVLVAGTGYNFYDGRDTLRANDQLIRQRASSALAEGARALAALEVEYRRRFLPAATRENPFPPAGEMERLRALGRLRARLDDLAVQINGMPVPAQDKTWWRFRDENATLMQLLQFDLDLLRKTDEVGQTVRALTAGKWQQEALMTEFDSPLAALETVARARAQFLIAL